MPTVSILHSELSLISSSIQVISKLPELSLECLQSVQNLNTNIRSEKRALIKIGDFLKKIHQSDASLFEKLKENAPRSAWAKLEKSLAL